MALPLLAPDVRLITLAGHDTEKGPQGTPMNGVPCGPLSEIFGIRRCATTLMYDGGTQLSARGTDCLRQLSDTAGVYLVVIVFRVLVLISRVVRLRGIFGEVALYTTGWARELTLKCRVVSVRGVVLDVPSLLGSFCLLTAAPHGVTPFCTWTGGGHLGYR